MRTRPALWSDVGSASHDREWREVQARAARLARFYATRVATGRAIARVEDRQALLQAVCDALLSEARHRMAWIGFTGPSGNVEPAAWAGVQREYWERAPVPAHLAPPASLGPTERAVMSGAPAVAANIGAGSVLLPWQENALARGFRSSAALPLRRHGTVVGALTVYAGEVGAFDDDEVRLLDGVAEDLSFGLDARAAESGRQVAEAARRSSEEAFRLLFQRHPQPMWVFDERTLRFLEVNDAALARYGYSRDEFLAMRVLDVRPPEDVRDLLEVLAGRAPGHGHRGVYRHRTKAGAIFPVEVTSYPVEDAGRSSLVMAQDVSERLRTEQALVHQATHDPLTGLANRALLSDRLTHALARANRVTDGLAVIFVDLDRFKVINDGRGHSAGDVVLREVAERMKGEVRSGDTVARVGGDEFVIVLEGPIARDAVLAVAARIAWAMDAPISVDGAEVFLTVSQGVAFAQRGDTADALLQEADGAMYLAKQAGRGRIHVADADLLGQASRQLDLETALRQAVDSNEFIVHYQPVVEVASGRIVGAEALLRWLHPQRGLLGPAEFISVAEDTGLIVPIGEWVLRQALEEAASWSCWGGADHGGPALSIAVNLSAAQLASRNLAFGVTRALSATGVEPSRLHLEVTESVLIGDRARAVEVLKALRSLGVRVDVDDFGTGYSSLAQVHTLPVDSLKIDKSFVDRLAGTDEDDALVAAVIQLAHSSHLAVIAEGVEDGTQRAQLVRLGCELAQGYLFSRPVDGARFRAMLAHGRTLPFDQPSDRPSSKEISR
jgi:diguanylate cyclase (GGDEF)-like protein/PAS domain S-box-containing protein